MVRPILVTRRPTRRHGGLGLLRHGFLVLAVTTAGACAGNPPTATPPGPVVAPRIDVAVDLTPRISGLTVPVLAPEPVGAFDALLTSPVLRDAGFAAEVDEWVGYWTEAAAGSVPGFLRRMGHFERMVDSTLDARRMPPSLRYLPFIESGYNPRATSHAAAVGMWQFMAGTARGFGMAVDPLVDERRNPFKSTDAATRYLSTLHDEFGSWFLALAAYNGGPTRTRRILRTHAPDAEPSDSLFWALRSHFPRETRQFVPKLVGAIVVASDPARHGYDHVRDPAFTFDPVTVPDATTLDVVARAAGTTEDEIARLNPELVRGITPRGRSFALRVPAGSAETFRTNYALVPAAERVTFVEHVVASGETLSHIARRYRISVTEIRAANPEIRPRYLRIGARLTVPVVPSAGTGS